LEANPDSKSAAWLWSEISLSVHHEPDLQVRGYGEVALEGSSAASNADPGAEEEGVAAVESGCWLMMMEVVEFAMRSLARSSTWRVSCRCFRLATYQVEYPRYANVASPRSVTQKRDTWHTI
jgi:hypothetical protein